jgi:hypothetical protein
VSGDHNVVASLICQSRLVGRQSRCQEQNATTDQKKVEEQRREPGAGREIGNGAGHPLAHALLDRRSLKACTATAAYTACQKGDLGNCGISGCGEGRTFNIIYRVMVCPEVGEGHITVEAE